MEKKLRNKHKGTGLTITKLLHLRDVFAKKKSELLELYRHQFASRKRLRRSLKKLLRSKPKRTNEKQQSKRVKLKKP
jgi:hypothetical protein